jgi:hypothetical protein
MHRFLAMIGVGAIMAFSPLVAVAQSDNQPMQVAQASTPSAHAGGGGSHSRHQRHRANQSKERARASAEHMRKM